MKNRARIERHFVYLLSAALLLAGTLLIMISRSVEGFWSPILEALGLALWPAALVAFILEYYLQRRWLQEILRSLQVDIVVVAAELGIVRLFRSRDEWDIERDNLYRNARNIKYLAVAPNMKEGGEFMARTFSELVERGVKIQVLACHPDSPFATQYYGFSSTDLGMKPIKDEISDAIDRLKLIQTRTKRAKGRLEFKIYEGSPGCYLQIIDGSAFFQSYLYDSSGTSPYVTQVDRGVQRELLERHFEAVWRHAITYAEFERQVSRRSAFAGPEAGVSN